MGCERSGKYAGKILLLLEKKKGIANELISTEQGFLKKLTKEDV